MLLRQLLRLPRLLKLLLLMHPPLTRLQPKLLPRRLPLKHRLRPLHLLKPRHPPKLQLKHPHPRPRPPMLLLKKQLLKHRQPTTLRLSN